MKCINVIYVVATVFIVGCSNSDNDLKRVHPNIGDYNVVSLISDTPMDLDYDGLPDKDFLSELDLYWFSSAKNFGSIPLEIRDSFEDSINQESRHGSGQLSNLSSKYDL